MAKVRLNLGCGKTTMEGFVGMDRRKFPGVDIVHDINDYPWPFADESVEEIHCSHVLEHFDHNRHNPERVRIMNEMYRILVPGGKATIITPHWASNRAYGDFTHADKPVCEMFYYYVSKEWRVLNAPDNDIEWNKDGYFCDFDATWGYSLNQAIQTRSLEYQQHALAFWKEAAQDMVATLVKRPSEPKESTTLIGPAQTGA